MNGTKWVERELEARSIEPDTVADNVLGPEKMSFSSLLFPYVKEFVVLLNFFVFEYVSFKRSTEPSALRSVVFMGALGNARLLQQIHIAFSLSCSHHSAFAAPCFLHGGAAEQVFSASEAEEEMLDLRLSSPTTSTASLATTRAEGAPCSCRTDLGSGGAATSAKPVGLPQCCQWMGRCTALSTAMAWSPWWMDPPPSCSPMDSSCQRW